MKRNEPAVVYLDYNATTPLLPEVWSAMQPFYLEYWGNPSSAHAFGCQANQAVEKARLQVATFVGAESSQVLFTSSATEANNTAIASALFQKPGKKRVVVSATEHSSVLNYCRELTLSGVEVAIVPVRSTGEVDLDALEAALTPGTALVSVMWANNETGVLNPVEEVSKLCLAKEILFHCDAVQVAGKIPINVREVQIDYLTLSGHKIFGPKGVGALVLNHGVPFCSLLHGGHQENQRRGGTENVPAIVGFGLASEIAGREHLARSSYVLSLRDRFEQAVLAEIEGSYLNGQGASRIPNTSNIGFSGRDSEALVGQLDQLGFCVSSGSACMSDSLSSSHVVQSMTGSYEKAGEAVRISISHLNKDFEIDQLLVCLRSIVV